MKVAVVGATGEVGRMMLRCLVEEDIPVTELRLFASSRSAGTELEWKGKKHSVELLTEDSMRETYDYLLFSAGGTTSGKYAPIAAAAGNTIIDNSSRWRQEKNIPLVVPEINASVLQHYKGIISNPNCSTIQMVLALAPLHKLFQLRKVIVSTYQSVSGSGYKGIAIMESQRMGGADRGLYPRMIDKNVIPQIGDFEENGYCNEENKMRFETNKILGSEEILVSATTVRVPVMYGHSESVYAEFAQPVEMDKAVEALKNSQSVVFWPTEYITPLELGESNDSHVCRLRYGVDNHSVAFWNVGNNVRLGAATNAVRIMKWLIENR